MTLHNASIGTFHVIGRGLAKEPCAGGVNCSICNKSVGSGGDKVATNPGTAVQSHWQNVSSGIRVSKLRA